MDEDGNTTEMYSVFDGLQSKETSFVVYSPDSLKPPKQLLPEIRDFEEGQDIEEVDIKIGLDADDMKLEIVDHDTVDAEWAKYV